VLKTNKLKEIPFPTFLHIHYGIKNYFYEKGLFTKNNHIFAPLIRKHSANSSNLERKKVVKNSRIPFNTINNPQ
jgi:hypothetical protein